MNTLTKKIKKVDHYLLLDDGPYVNPTDLLEEGNIDIARL